MPERRPHPALPPALLALLLALGAARPARAQAAAPQPASADADAGMPRLRKQGTATQLVVDGAPFLVLGGELGNSTGSSMAALRPAWARLRALHLNTVVAPVYWELTEPEEGRYTFALVDSLLGDARAQGMRLVLLWFGAYKNSMASYAPPYVKTDQRRFPRTEAARGQGQELLAPYGAETARVDARAFAALMRHLKRVDGRQHTVLMVQVENEIGMIPEARDHSAAADALFAQPVPRELMAYLERHRAALAPDVAERWAAAGRRAAGTWEEVFGRSVYTDELFMAWHFARYAERVAAAGKAEYALPMFVNAALIRPGYTPGRYVSAGPLPHLVDVWRAGAPSVDFLAPDIYFPNFVEWSARYVRAGNPLFVPEARLGPHVAVNAFYAVGGLDAIGYSPFAVESPAGVADTALERGYDLLTQLTPLVLAHQGRGTMAGLTPPVAVDGTTDDRPQRVSLGTPYTLTVTFANPPGPPTISPGQPGAAAMTAGRAAPAPAPPPAAPRGGIVIALGPDEFLVAGTGLIVTFAPADGAGSAGILRMQEGHYERGRWVGGRWMNGDQSHQGRHLSLPPGEFGMQRVKLYRYR